jgi:hypothetical protein
MGVGGLVREREKDKAFINASSLLWQHNLKRI